MLKPLALLASLGASSAPPLRRRPRTRSRSARSTATRRSPPSSSPYKKGWELAVEEVNAAGGVLGKKLAGDLARRQRQARATRSASPRSWSRARASALIAGTFLSNIGLAVTDFAKQKKVFFLAAEPLTDKITWQNGNRYTFRLRPNTYMQSAMLVPEAAKLKKKRWAVVYPNYEYGQSAAATFKAMLKKAASPTSSSSPSRRRRSAGSRPARWCRRSPTPSPTRSSTSLFGADLSKFVREGNTRGLFKGRAVVSLLTGEPEYLEPLQATKRPSAGSSPAIRGLRHPDRRAQEVLPRLLPQVQRLPAARLGGRLLDHHVDRRRHQEGEVDRHREADRRVQRPAGR